MPIFRASSEIYFGSGAPEELLARIGGRYSSCVAVIDSSLAGSSGLEFVEEMLSESVGACRYHFRRSGKEPTYQELDELSEVFRSTSPDLVVGIGGGSVMDLAKGLSVTLSGPPGAAREYRGMNHVHHVNLDCLLVPSTAGSGSEMTYTVALIDETTRVKLGINGDNVFPRYALLIPDFLLTAPNNVVIGSALDVLVHSSEALSSTSRNQFASPLAAAAISSVIEHLPAFCAARQRGLVPKLEAEALLLAAAQAGSAVMNSSGGMASAISYPVGTLFNVPHGFAGGIPLPYVMKIQEQEGFSLAPTLRLDSPFSDILFELYSRLGVPGSFASWGVSASDRDLVHSRVLSERQVGLLSDPVGADEEALKTVLHQVMP